MSLWNTVWTVAINKYRKLFRYIYIFTSPTTKKDLFLGQFYQWHLVFRMFIPDCRWHLIGAYYMTTEYIIIKVRVVWPILKQSKKCLLIILSPGEGKFCRFYCTRKVAFYFTSQFVLLQFDWISLLDVQKNLLLALFAIHPLPPPFTAMSVDTVPTHNLNLKKRFDQKSLIIYV